MRGFIRVGILAASGSLALAGSLLAASAASLHFVDTPASATPPSAHAAPHFRFTSADGESSVTASSTTDDEAGDDTGDETRSGSTTTTSSSTTTVESSTTTETSTSQSHDGSESQSESRNSESETKDTESETKDTESETKDTESESADNESNSRDDGRDSTSTRALLRQLDRELQALLHKSAQAKRHGDEHATTQTFGEASGNRSSRSSSEPETNWPGANRQQSSSWQEGEQSGESHDD